MKNHFKIQGHFFWCKENENLIKMLTVYIHSYKLCTKYLQNNKSYKVQKSFI